MVRVQFLEMLAEPRATAGPQTQRALGVELLLISLHGALCRDGSLQRRRGPRTAWTQLDARSPGLGAASSGSRLLVLGFGFWVIHSGTQGQAPSLSAWTPGRFLQLF